jgi:hypothetical protein
VHFHSSRWNVTPPFFVWGGGGAKNLALFLQIPEDGLWIFVLFFEMDEFVSTGDGIWNKNAGLFQ